MPDDFPIDYDYAWKNETGKGIYNFEENSVQYLYFYIDNIYDHTQMIPINTELTFSEGNYTYRDSYMNYTLTFFMDETMGIFTSIGLSGEGVVDGYEGTFKKVPSIKDILPQDFPSSDDKWIVPNNAWVSENGATSYVGGNILCFNCGGAVNSYNINAELSYDSENSRYVNDTNQIYFYMDGASLDKIMLQNFSANGFDGEYKQPKCKIADILPTDFPTSINSTWKNASDKKVFAYDGYLRFSDSDDLSIPLNSVIDTSNNRYIVNFTTSSGKVVKLEFCMEYGGLYRLCFESAYQQYSSYQGEYRIRKSISDILPDGSVLPRYDAAIFTTESGNAYIYYDSGSNNLKVCSKDKSNIAAISCNEKVIRNYLGDYECAFDEGFGNDVKLDFYVIENKVASIKLHYQGSPDGYIDAFRGTYAKRKTIAEILPEDFPVDFTTNQWANQNGHTIIYSDSNKESIKFNISSGNTKYIDVSENVVVSSSSSGVEYFYSDPDSDVTLKFSQPREALECINISGDSVGEEYKGDYVKLNEATLSPTENPGHVHNYVWREISAPTIYSDGLEEEVCTVCGDIRNSNSISAMSFAIENYAMSLIQAAKPGQTVTFEFGEWNSFPKEFMAKLVDKSAQNVTFVFKYNWNHKLQTITIPAGTHIDLNFDWYGPAKMAELYGANKR